MERKIFDAHAHYDDAWFDEDRNRLPDYTIERHKPAKVEAKSNNEINKLKK